MCLAVPGRVLSVVDGDPARPAKIAFGGVIKSVSLELLPDAVAGDYVIVHAGVAISVLDAAEAEAVFAELEALEASRAAEDAL